MRHRDAPGRRPVLHGKWVVLSLSALRRQSDRSCRCLARCFGGRRHPCPCTRSPFGLAPPNRKFNALALDALRRPSRQPLTPSVRFGLVRHSRAAVERPCRRLTRRRGRADCRLSRPLDCLARARTAGSARCAPPTATSLRPAGVMPTDLRSDEGDRLGRFMPEGRQGRQRFRPFQFLIALPPRTLNVQRLPCHILLDRIEIYVVYPVYLQIKQ